MSQRGARVRGTRIGVAVLFAFGVASAGAAETSGSFAGSKVNRGTVSFHDQNGQRTLTLSPDFEKPGTPDPHWQVVDSKGVVYPLQRLDIKGDRFNGSVVLPAYVPDVAKVQIWCAFAESLLGEASFAKPVH
jgi:hypothetical protein